MKKLVFAAVFIIITALLNAQTTNDTSLNGRDYEGMFLLPEAISSGCASLDAILAPHCWNSHFEHEYAPNVFSIWTFNRSSFLASTPSVTNDDFAQPYVSDTAIKIIGLAGYFTTFGYEGSNNSYTFYSDSLYFQIKTFANNIPGSVLCSKSIVNNSDCHWCGGNYHAGTPHYTEVMFDSPLYLTGKFYAVISDENVIHDGLEYILAVNSYLDGEGCPIKDSSMLPLRYMIDRWKIQRRRAIRETGSGNPDDWPLATAFYIFPIIDTSYNDPANDSSSLTEVLTNEVTQLFPNPSYDIINIRCPSLMKDITIYDPIGRIIERKEINDSKIALDISSYNKGHYIAKINSNTGLIIKKFIVTQKP